MSISLEIASLRLILFPVSGCSRLVALNLDNNIDGMLLQLPISKKFDVQKSLYKIISLRILGSFPQIATQQPILVGGQLK